MRRDVFQAIADPTRRTIIHMLSSGDMNLNSVAEKFDMSRPAISKHIKILTECGLVAIRPEGRERYCEARLSKLGEVADWVTHYKEFWNNKLDDLERFLAATAVHERTKKTIKRNVQKKIKSKRKSRS